MLFKILNPVDRFGRKILTTILTYKIHTFSLEIKSVRLDKLWTDFMSGTNNNCPPTDFLKTDNQKHSSCFHDHVWNIMSRVPNDSESLVGGPGYR